MTSREFVPYVNGDTIRQIWSGTFVFFAFIVAFVASYSAVRLLDHTIWRSEKEIDNVSFIIIKFPQFIAAGLLGFGTVWSMHFVGMAAVTLERVKMCYDWPVTIGSLLSAIVFMWVGVKIAEQDIFRKPDRLAVLKDVVIKIPKVTAKGKHKAANRIIHRVAFFHRPWHILVGGSVAALGALVMHYTGMIALRGPFVMKWSIPFVAGSVILGVVVCCVGFWILFRLLRWKVEQFWLRPVSAVVIALAVCSLHFFGMLGVTYEYDDSKFDACGADYSLSIESNPDGWSTHQVLALAVALCIPSLALLVETLIGRELFFAYSNVKNPSLTIEFLLKRACQSGDEGVRRAGVALRMERRRSLKSIESMERAQEGLSREEERSDYFGPLEASKKGKLPISRSSSVIELSRDLASIECGGE